VELTKLCSANPSYYPASLLWSPGPRPSPVFRSAVCDCLSLIKRIYLSIHMMLFTAPQFIAKQGAL
jgi:hypothetical protein